MHTKNAPVIPELEHHIVTGGGGARLHVVETGNADGRALIFLHGFSQSWLAWQPQMCSDLAQDYRLVAVDLRGHGSSDKPDEGYAEGKDAELKTLAAKMQPTVEQHLQQAVKLAGK